MLELGPEFLFAEPLPFAELLAGALQDGTQARRICHEQSLDLILVLHADDDRNRPPVARNNDRPAFTGLQEGAELRLYLSNLCNLHSWTSSPPMNRRSLCFSPIAKICTTRSS